MIIANILVLLVEALYFYIPLKEIKHINFKRDKFKLYIGIFLSNIISTILFNNQIFRYTTYPILIYITIKIINKESRVYDFFIISFLMGFKFVLEFLISIMLINKLDMLVIIFIFELTNILSVIILKNIIIKIYKLLCNKWNGYNTFYLRYILLIIFNLLIFFIIYNLIIIKEVL